MGTNTASNDARGILCEPFQARPETASDTCPHARRTHVMIVAPTARWTPQTMWSELANTIMLHVCTKAVTLIITKQPKLVEGVPRTLDVCMFETGVLARRCACAPTIE